LSRNNWRKASRGKALPESAVAEGDVEEEESKKEYGSPYSSVEPIFLSMSCNADRLGPNRSNKQRKRKKQNKRFEKGREMNGAKEPATFTKLNKKTSTKPIRLRVKSSSKGRRRILLKKKKEEKKRKKSIQF
jgi:hypothetical protein